MKLTREEENILTQKLLVYDSDNRARRENYIQEILKEFKRDRELRESKEHSLSFGVIKSWLCRE